ncbi:MAG: phospho-sugar mutase [Acidimicrobiales bacterium]|jgi:phosphomannomutase
MSRETRQGTQGGVLPAELVARVSAWVAEDPDPGSRAELEALLAQGDEGGLRDRFDHPLAFGTAGLRGPLGAGPGRVNPAVVRRTTAGLVSYLRDLGKAGVVVGHDARHRSAELAADAARVVAAGGLRAWHFRSALPTPVTAFAVRHLEAAAGVMVTASHNPAPDNGYKVYLGDGALVFPPYDAAIAAAASKAAMPLGPCLEGPFADRLVELDEAELLAAYRRAVLAVVGPTRPRRLRMVYTPVHGVGGAVLPELLEEAGFARPALVAAQAQPDPDFPTAPFPNPEEPGVLDLALAEAGRLGADLLLANDPDADRLAVAVPDRGGTGFRVLSGDELGVLIADHLISTTAGADRLVATTVVSSSMLSALAAQTGVAYVETLTGFKWIARAAQRRPGHRLLFGYEEALGYAVTNAVADKDGLSAGLVVADMAARAQDQGRSLVDRLDELECRLGVHTTGQWSVRLAGSDAPDVLSALMARLRASPPGRLAGLEVTGVRDLAKGDDELPPSDVLVLHLGGAGRVVLRPSGTEPKLKAYLEATTGPCAPEDLGEARRGARARLEELRQEVAAVVTGGS